MPKTRTQHPKACVRGDGQCVVKMNGPVRDHPLAIICTVGPSISLSAPRRDGKYSDPRAHTDLAALVDNGMAAARINFSHVTKAGFARVDRLIAAIRAIEHHKRRPIPIIMDLGELGTVPYYAAMSRRGGASYIVGSEDSYIAESLT